jgi:hypothetical protein
LNEVTILDNPFDHIIRFETLKPGKHGKEESWQQLHTLQQQQQQQRI